MSAKRPESLVYRYMTNINDCSALVIFFANYFIPLKSIYKEEPRDKSSVYLNSFRSLLKSHPLWETLYS